MSLTIPFDLRIDLGSGKPVVSPSDLSLASLPNFVEGVSLDLRIWGIQKIAGVPSYLPVSGVTLFVALGNLVASPPTYFTQQATWTPNGDLAQPFFEALLPMNVSFAFNGARSITADFGVFFFSGGQAAGALQKRVVVQKSLYSVSSLVVPIGQTAISAEAVRAMLQNIVTQSVTIQSSDLAHSRRLWEDTDGTPHDDQS